MKTLSLLLLLAAIPMFGQAVDPAKVLFDAGTRDEEAGRPERAKLVLLTLASTYQGHPLADKAKVEIGAIYLFLEAQAQVQSGKTQEGYDSFRRIMRVYPDSPLAKLADGSAKSLGIPADPRR
jgi:outer membrane protein assembly factor BamD (BamD/ComL family)